MSQSDDMRRLLEEIDALNEADPRKKEIFDLMHQMGTNVISLREMVARHGKVLDRHGKVLDELKSAASVNQENVLELNRKMGIIISMMQKK